MVRNRMATRSSKEQANRFICSPFENERTRVSSVAEGCTPVSDNDNLPREREVAEIVAYSHVRIDTRHLPNCVARGSAEFVNRHVDRSSFGSLRWADMQDVI